ncbi:MAG TPA: molybdopterin-binding protein [Polyangiaceae bacterium]|jgi:molybdenum cofactor synthesis domain-containing protein|nr:molybdopterin-binding protein [Polyangiaceae bacterium]
MEGAARTAAALLIGNELLSGKVHESNLVELARTLRSLGVALRRVVMLPDEMDAIAAEVRALSDTHDVVFTSGGVGPTHDDITLEAVAKAFGVKAVVHPEFEALLQAVYGDRMTDAHRRMALAPEGAELVSHAEARWPTVVMKNVWVLPGVPEAFRMKLGVVRAKVRGASRFVTREVITKMDEPDLKPLLDRVVAAHPDVEIGSYPKWFDPRYKTKVTFDGTDESKVVAAQEDFVAQLPEGEPQTDL